MILDSYLEDLAAALELADQEGALTQLHAMAQRDPLDQRGLIAGALGEILARWPDLSANPGSDPPTSETQVPEDIELALGRALHLLHEQPSATTLESIRGLAHRLVDAGELTATSYEPVEDRSDEREAPRHEGPASKPAGSQALLALGLAVLGGLILGGVFCSNRGSRSPADGDAVGEASRVGSSQQSELVSTPAGSPD